MGGNYEKILVEPNGYDAARHKVLTVNRYSIGNNHGNIVWHAPCEVANPLTLDEAWNHFLSLPRSAPETVTLEWFE